MDRKYSASSWKHHEEFLRDADPLVDELSSANSTRKGCRCASATSSLRAVRRTSGSAAPFSKWSMTLSPIEDWNAAPGVANREVNRRSVRIAGKARDGQRDFLRTR